MCNPPSPFLNYAESLLAVSHPAYPGIICCLDLIPINSFSIFEFSYLLRHALALDADYLATGHYARIRQANNHFQLLKSSDPNKDQSYVLHVLGQHELAHTIFPIGDLTKDEVRELAERFKLPVVSKPESMDLCFLGDGDYRRFLAENTDIMERMKNLVREKTGFKKAAEEEEQGKDPE